MQSTSRLGQCSGLMLLVPILALSGIAVADAPQFNAVVSAVRHGDCANAVELVNHANLVDDPQALFWGGRMLAEGICVDQDDVSAAKFYLRSAELGDLRAPLDRAAYVGLGVSTVQSYPEAGELCRKAGVDPGTKVSSAELGYVCTLRGLASRIVRQTIPPNALRVPAEPVRIAFHPRSGVIDIVSMPHVLAAPLSPIGSNLRRPLVDLGAAVQDAWRRATEKAPKPADDVLDDQIIEVALDVDLALEAGAPAADRSTSAAPGPILHVGDLHHAK